MTLILAVDTGGTFTDLAVYNGAKERVSYAKCLTTYHDLVAGVIDAITKSGTDLSGVDVVKFGTTLVTNTFAQRTGARTALVTTDGYGDVLEIRRGNRPLPFDLRHKFEPPLARREHCFEVVERLSTTGEVVRPLSEDELDSLTERLRLADVEAIAVSLVNAFTNSAHEDTVVRHLRRNLPDAFITAGTELSREWGEYERASTAVANAYVGPPMRDYIGRLDSELKARGLKKPFFLMAANGGIFAVDRACSQPIMLVESGPVAGCIGAGVYAEVLGLDKVIAFDMGGTTAKCAVIENGKFDVRSPYFVGGVEHGFPIRGGVVDIVEVGAGGGSIAYVDDVGRLHVGPRSAGSTPGPICYGRGGRELTITDANLVLGRLDADAFLGGEMHLDAPSALAAVERFGKQLGIEGDDAVERTAQGIIALGSTIMSSAIKQITMQRGLDPRNFSIIAFGGGGPLHGATLARELGIRELIVPPEPGNFCALGMILSDARMDQAQTFLRPLEDGMLPEIRKTLHQLEIQAREAYRLEFGTGLTLDFTYQAEMRFRGQTHAMRIVIDPKLDEAAIRECFESNYARRYGHVEVGSPLQFVNLLVTTSARMERPALEALRPNAQAIEKRVNRTRSVYFDELGHRVECKVYRRADLPNGFKARGPGIIEEYGSTTVVGPFDAFEIGALGEIWVRFPQRTVA